MTKIGELLVLLQIKNNLIYIKEVPYIELDRLHLETTHSFKKVSF